MVTAGSARARLLAKWWKRRRWDLAVQQLEAGKTGEEAFFDVAMQNPLTAGTAMERRIFRSITHAKSSTEWRGD
jgi:hypothetical protein